MTKRKTIGLISLMLFSLTASKSIAATKYVAADLGAGVIPSAINENGDIVGTVVNAKGGPQAFLNRAGETIVFGRLGGLATWGTAINDAADIAGTICTGDRCTENPKWSADKHIFVRKQGEIKDLSHTGMIEASGMNNSGVILGRSLSFDEYGSYLQHVILYDSNSGAVTEANQGYGTDCNLYPIALNNAGDVVYVQNFWSDRESGTTYLYKNGLRQFLGYWQATDMNESDVMIGIAGYPGTGVTYSDQLAYLPDVHGLRFLPVAIANDGLIVGEALTIDRPSTLPRWSTRKYMGNVAFAAVYSDKKLTPLQELITGSEDQWTIKEVLDVNGKGQIIGYGTKNGEPDHGILLTPVKPEKTL